MSGLASKFPASQHPAKAASLLYCQANSESAELSRKTDASVSFGGGSAVLAGLQVGSRYQRPPGHFCPACECLMLSSERQPVHLEPCGHTACSRCAGGGSVVVCPTCRSSAVRGQLNCGLQQEVINFSGVILPASYPESSTCTQDVVNDLATNHLPVAQIQQQSNAGGIARPETAHNNIQQRQQQQQPSLQLQSYRQHHSESTKRWNQQLEMISGRMRALEGSLEQLHVELDSLNHDLVAELNRDRQLKQAEVDTRERIEQLQDELRRLEELRAASRDGQHFIQSQIETKKQAIQAAFMSQHGVTMELSKLQSLCGGGVLGSSSDK